MRSLRSMRKGNVSAQYLKVKHKNKAEPAIRGPYYTFTFKEGKKTVGYRLTTGAQLEAARLDIAAHQQFVALCRKYEQLTERLGELERAAVEESPKKKRRKSPSSRIGK
jgi:hypothetical protein